MLLSITEDDLAYSNEPVGDTQRLGKWKAKIGFGGWLWEVHPATGGGGKSEE